MHSKHGVLAAGVLAASTLAACGSSSSSSTSTPPATTSTPAAATTAASTPTTPPATTTGAAATAVSGGKVTVTSTEYAFAPTALTAKAGTVKVTLDNQGKIPHEFILLKTGAAPDSLKVNAKTSRISEAASVGEVSETDAGKSATTTFHLKAGSYVFVCNIPTHYGQGMRGTLTVK